MSRASAMAAAAERGFVNALGGGCASPIAAHAEFPDGPAEGKRVRMTLRGFYYDDTTNRSVRKCAEFCVDSPAQAAAAGRELAAAVLEDR